MEGKRRSCGTDRKCSAVLSNICFEVYKAIIDLFEQCLSISYSSLEPLAAATQHRFCHPDRKGGRNL